MDKPSAHHIRRPKQAKAKAKKEPIKVVYIANPMKVKTSASKFRALVQGLTGRDSDLADIEKILAIDGVDERQRVPDHHETHDEGATTDHYVPSPVTPALAVDHHERESSSASSTTNGSESELFDGVFTAEMMLENLTGLSPASRLFFDPQGDFFKGLDVV